MANRWGMRACGLGVIVPALQFTIVQPAMAQDSLFVAYPPANHTTVSDRIFFIGTANPGSDVLLNGNPIAERSPAGHFAPTLPLAIGNNRVTITQGSESLTFNITRNSLEPPQPNGIAF
ncbi:MAG: N-acetylmuramoyl-L-alanine amidase, partial [Cyanobacteria bacterium J06628_4]